MFIRTYQKVCIQTTSALMVIGYLCAPTMAFAQHILTNTSLGGHVDDGKFRAQDIVTFMKETIGTFYSFIGALCLIMIIISGYQIALAKAIGRDRSEGLTRLRVAIVGFILSVLTWYIIDFVISALTIVPPN
ncbi:MAG: hypothetical protein O2904_04130 [bacterium]|nr:hypothetical protein [bacterium]